MSSVALAKHIVAGGALIAILCGCGVAPKERSPTPASSADAETARPLRVRRGGTNVTFLVTADTHFGFGVPPSAPENRDPVARPLGIERIHTKVIDLMNRIEGRPYPEPIGGRVGRPRGVLVAGDLTENGRPQEWKSFRAYYGKLGNDGLLAFPVFETAGNHDQWPVRREVERDRGALYYSWDWSDLHIVCLGEAPDDVALKWLANDLTALGPDVPIIVYLHFPLAGPYSDTWFGRSKRPAQLREMLQGHNVLGIFHGHYHASGSYRWRGLDVYNVGSAKHDWKSFAVVHVDDGRMHVAEYNYAIGVWWWWQEKPINGAPGREKLGVRPKQPREIAAPYMAR